MHLNAQARKRLAEELQELAAMLDEDISQRPGSGGDPADLADMSMAVEQRRNAELRVKRIKSILDADSDSHEQGHPTEVRDGCVVELVYQGDNSSESFWFGELDTRGEDMDVVTPSSPLGQALLGAKPGTTVKYNAPTGELAVSIVGIR